MNTEILERAFTKMGARLKTEETDRIGWNRREFTVDIGTDKDGEYFYLRTLAQPAPRVEILNVDKRDRHLLLMIEHRNEKSKFLCGHDERHWFVAAIPEKAAARDVATAKDALRPEGLLKDGNWKRQGEWFFVPTTLRLPKNAPTLHDEPLVRRTSDGRGGKPHIATECYRQGGETVLVHSRYAPQGFTEEQYKDWLAQSVKGAERVSFTRMTRNAEVYVRGEIRHADHATLKLRTIWHKVLMNRENESLAMASMVFLD